MVTDTRLKDQATWEKFLRAILKGGKIRHREQTNKPSDSIAKYVKLDPKLLWRGFYSPYLDQSATPTSRASNTLPT
ncbi:MAG: hypothetical protein U1E47_00160 [Rivihabitans pingtungensis]